ncbi:hypothetical protein KBA63_01705 [Candidatus Woesebacteria bacterium]|nr:hypothetical protein [Candidatus Woesebacteria bacterium]
MNPEEPVSPTLESKMALFKRLVKSPKITRVKRISSFAVIALVAVSSFYLAKRITQPVHVAEKSNAATLTSLRIMNVYYVPATSPWAGKLTDIFHLSSSVRTYVGFGSAFHGDLTKQMVSVDEVAPAYFRAIARPIATDDDPYNAKMKTYKEILNDTRDGKSICQIVQEQNLDQVWLWVDSTVDKAPGFEFKVINPTSNYGDALYNDVCANSKSFTLMGYDYSTPVANAVHSFSHYLEALLEPIQGRDLFVGRFEGLAYNGTINDRYISSPYPPYVMSEKCGNVHTPPNIALTSDNYYDGYIYNSPNSVLSSCEYWNPDGTGTKVAVNVDTWLSKKLPSTFADSTLPSPELSYLIWWMQNLNHESSGNVFNGKKIPSWWSFVSNTDNVINTYKSLNYWMSETLQSPVASTKTAFCTNESGTYSSCTYTPGSSTLGASTENKNVLAATTYGDMALVTVSYGNASATVSSVTFCGDAMTRVGTGPFSGAGTKNEMWYKLTPQSGVCPVTVKFSVDPGQRVVSTTIFNNIDQVVPVTGFTTGGLASGFTANPGAITATLTGPKDSLMICGYAHYSEQSNPPSGNFATANPGTTQLWTFKQSKYASGAPVNTWAGLGAGVQRLTANQSTTLSWKTVKSQPNSYTCANFNVKPFASTTTTPTTTVDIKAQAGDGPVTIPYNSSLTISWSTTLATSCTASGAWTGAKGINGSQVIAGVVTSGTYTITCNGKSDSVSVVVTPPTVNLKIGTSDGPFTVPYNGSFTLSWTAPGATACTASGSWTGAKLASGSLLITAVTTNRTYTLTCNGGTDSISVVVTQPTVDLKVGTSDGPVNVAYNGSFTLSWTTKLATACTASGSWTGAKLVNGSLVVNNVIANKTYTLTCNGVTDTISIVSLPPVVTVDLKASYSDGPVNLLWGDSVWLTWYTANATSCTASNGWTGTKAANGTEYFYPLTTTKTYTITCGGKTDSVTINVAPLPAPTESGNITYKLITPTTLPTTFTRGQVVTLVYRITEPDGTPGTPDEGFGVQTYVDNTVQSVVGVNGEYDATTGNWTSKLTMPSIAGTYTYYSSAYCGRWKSGRYSCGYKYTTFQRQQLPNPSVSIIVK